MISVSQMIIDLATTAKHLHSNTWQHVVLDWRIGYHGLVKSTHRTVHHGVGLLLGSQVLCSWAGKEGGIRAWGDRDLAYSKHVMVASSQEWRNGLEEGSAHFSYIGSQSSLVSSSKTTWASSAAKICRWRGTLKVKVHRCGTDTTV